MKLITPAAVRLAAAAFDAFLGLRATPAPAQPMSTACGIDASSQSTPPSGRPLLFGLLLGLQTGVGTCVHKVYSRAWNVGGSRGLNRSVFSSAQLYAQAQSRADQSEVRTGQVSTSVCSERIAWRVY